MHKLPGAKLAQFSLVGAAGIRSGASWAVFGRLLEFLLAILEPGDSILEVWDAFWRLQGVTRSISQGVGGLAEPFKSAVIRLRMYRRVKPSELKSILDPG